MFDKNNHVSGAAPLDGTPDDRCFGNAAYVVGVVGNGEVPAGLPPQCTDLMTNLRTARKNASATDNKGEQAALATALMAVSETKCGSYRNFLTQFHGNVRSTFGITSQLAAIIASLATGNASQWFAGAAAGLGGAGGTLNNAHFYDQALPTLTDAFVKRRAKKKDEIEKKLADKDKVYRLGDVMTDVQEFHNDCSLGAGLEELKDSLKEANTPSAETVKTYLNQQKELREVLRNFLTEEAKKDQAAGANP